MLMAISAGVSAPMSVPIGIWHFWISSREKPSASSLSVTTRILFLLPMIPM